MYANSIKTLRQIIHELRRAIPQGNLKDNLAIRYLFDQYRLFNMTDQQICKAKDEVLFAANTYLCYLRSSRIQQEIHNQYHGKGERSVKETANIVGFKLPHDPK
ncbi:hypothetical protein PPYR_04535 [Photinus pyralis]|uniref:Protein FMC1 homolog n=1 Tax=Photinus pyralis TaxID=7054 RepID=A0A1Y1L668_PHOPY|nr:hypothetical protein PPYR_04535 [Photinus pyralis]